MQLDFNVHFGRIDIRHHFEGLSDLVGAIQDLTEAIRPHVVGINVQPGNATPRTPASEVQKEG